MAGIITQRRPIDKELEAIKSLTENLERGDLITHKEIEDATNLKKDIYPWPRLIG